MAKNNNAGTCFLSYLCEIGIIENSDSVELNYVEGKLLKDYFGIKAGNRIYIAMDDGETLDIAYAPSCQIDPDDIPYWGWEQNPAKKEKKFKICLSFVPSV